MLKRQLSRSASICDGFRQLHFTHLGRGFLPLLAAILLVAPSLAFANGLTVTVNPSSLDLHETGTPNALSYSVELDDKPEQDVMVKVVGETNTQGDVIVRGSNGQEILTVSPGTLNFTLTGQAIQNITVTAVPDLDGVNERVTLTHTATIGDNVQTLRDATVRVFVEDPGEQVVILSDQDVTVTEAGASDTYAVTLNTRPTGTVTVDVGGDTGEISVSPSRLVFTPDPSTNYSTEQTVTVSAGRDFDADIDTATLTHRVSGADYSTVRAESVAVTVEEADSRGITVSTPTGTNTMPVAAGSSGVFTIRLTSQPKGVVVVEVRKDPNTVDNNQVSVAPSKVSFSARDWNQPKPVTIKTTDKADESEGDQPRSRSVSIELTVDEGVRNSDVDYTDALLSTATITVGIEADLPDPGISLSPASLTVRESSSGKYTVKLSKSPADAEELTVFFEVHRREQGDRFASSDNVFSSG